MKRIAPGHYKTDDGYEIIKKNIGLWSSDGKDVRVVARIRWIVYAPGHKWINDARTLRNAKSMLADHREATLWASRMAIDDTVLLSFYKHGTLYEVEGVLYRIRGVRIAMRTERRDTLHWNISDLCIRGIENNRIECMLSGNKSGKITDRFIEANCREVSS